MQIDQIITLANEPVRLRFVAMERSLRAVGWDGPLRVIPYDGNRFPLPAGSEWWEIPALQKWITTNRCHPTMGKYQCLLEKNYQFVDADVIFLRDPRETLAGSTGFITSCGHWRHPGGTTTGELIAAMEKKYTLWETRIFNTGQFACDRALFSDMDALAAATARYPDTCINFRFHEQPGINLLAFLSGVEVTNLTLPPRRMESTWAGDYPGEFHQFWTDEQRSPYLIHWAGTSMWVPRPINELIYQYLTADERREWDALVETQKRKRLAIERSLKTRLRKVRDVFRQLF